jgi:saccharopine dehydrogenase-like NADP-dependent oxidoreductase
VNDPALLAKLLEGADAVLSALPYFCDEAVAKAARAANCHFLDLTEDVATTDKIVAIAKGASSVFMPQCGLAPGFISIAAYAVARQFEKVDSIKMRVGALPIYPSNMIKYNLTWSTDGLINEYGNPCEAIIDGKLHSVQPLEGLERFSLDGVEYEAFNTSGGLGSMCETMLGKARLVDYKTIRYPGHRDLFWFLMRELRFNEGRNELKQILERSIPAATQDKCIIFVEVRGTIAGQFTQRTAVSTVYHTEVNKKQLSAIQVTTASGICAPLDLLLTGKLGDVHGFYRCEDIPLELFLSNEFGKHYNSGSAQRPVT